MDCGGVGLPPDGRARGARRVAPLGALIGLVALTGYPDSPDPPGHRRRDAGTVRQPTEGPRG